MSDIKGIRSILYSSVANYYYIHNDVTLRAMSMRIKSKTCLAMLRDKEGYLWFAGDRRISWDFSKAMKAPRPKVTKRNNILFAGTGSSVVCELVTDQCPVPDIPADMDSYRYMHAVFVPSLIKWLRAQGWVEEKERKLNVDEDNYGEAPSACIIIGVESDLYEVNLDNNIISADCIDAPYAEGCGGPLAMGSLLTTEHLCMDPPKRLNLALQIASKVSPGCDDNVDIVTNRPEDL